MLLAFAAKESEAKENMEVGNCRQVHLKAYEVNSGFYRHHPIYGLTPKSPAKFLFESVSIIECTEYNSCSGDHY